MTKNDIFGLQPFMRLERAPDVSQKCVYEAYHRIRSWSNALSRRKTPSIRFSEGTGVDLLEIPRNGALATRVPNRLLLVQIAT